MQVSYNIINKSYRIYFKLAALIARHAMLLFSCNHGTSKKTGSMPFRRPYIRISSATPEINGLNIPKNKLLGVS